MGGSCSEWNGGKHTENGGKSMNNGPEDAACGEAEDYVESIKNHEKNQIYEMEWEKVRMEHVALMWRIGRLWNGQRKRDNSGPLIAERSTVGDDRQWSHIHGGLGLTNVQFR